MQEETQQPAPAPAKVAPQLFATQDLSIEQVRSTLQLINKMLRKQAQPQELAALLKIKEVREILDLHKVNPKESSERINQYQKDLTARLRAHDRGKRPADEPAHSPDDTVKKAKTYAGAAVSEEHAESKPVPRKQRKSLTGILAQSELALPPSAPPSSKEFDVEWIQYFFQLMCSKIPFFSDRKLLVPGQPRSYIEESEDQRVYVDGLSSAEIILLLNCVYDLELNLKTSAKNSLLVPNKLTFLSSMGDPLESGLLEAWYFTHTAQCATCALRFANRKLLTIHHDYHFHKYTAGQRRKRGLENNFRGWMETPQEFLGSKEVQFGFDMYKKLDEGFTNPENPFLQTAGLVSPASSDHVMVDVSQGAAKSGESHSALTITVTQQLTKSILPDSVPVDEIKTRCLECGEMFEKQWIGEPVDMAVYKGVVALPVGGATPLQFRWPIQAKEQTNVDLEEEDDGIDAAAQRAEQHKIDAVNALFDHRFVNSMLLHKNCLADNPPLLKEKQKQLDLLFSGVGERRDPLHHLRPPRETIVAAADIAVIEEVEDDDYMQVA